MLRMILTRSYMRFLPVQESVQVCPVMDNSSDEKIAGSWLVIRMIRNDHACPLYLWDVSKQHENTACGRRRQPGNDDCNYLFLLIWYRRLSVTCKFLLLASSLHVARTGARICSNFRQFSVFKLFFTLKCSRIESWEPRIFFPTAKIIDRETDAIYGGDQGRAAEDDGEGGKKANAFKISATLHLLHRQHRWLGNSKRRSACWNVPSQFAHAPSMGVSQSDPPALSTERFTASSCHAR